MNSPPHHSHSLHSQMRMRMLLLIKFCVASEKYYQSRGESNGRMSTAAVERLKGVMSWMAWVHLRPTMDGINRVLMEWMRVLVVDAAEMVRGERSDLMDAANWILMSFEFRCRSEADRDDKVCLSKVPTTWKSSLYIADSWHTPKSHIEENFLNFPLNCHVRQACHSSLPSPRCRCSRSHSLSLALFPPKTVTCYGEMILTRRTQNNSFSFPWFMTAVVGCFKLLVPRLFIFGEKKKMRERSE